MTHILLPVVRISYPHLEVPHIPPIAKNSPGAVAKYQATFLLDPSDPTHAHIWQQVQSEIQRLAEQKWQDLAPSVLQAVSADRRLRGYGTGEEVKNKKFEVEPGYAGMIYVNAKTERQPDIIDPATSRAIDPANAMGLRAAIKQIYAGCYVNALVQPWLQDNAAGRGVRFDLAAVQFAKDGEAFGRAAVDAAAYFKPTAVQPAPGGGFQEASTQFAPGQAPQTQTVRSEDVPPLPKDGAPWL